MNHENLRGTSCIQLILKNQKQYFLHLQYFDEKKKFGLQVMNPGLQDYSFQSIVLSYPDYGLVMDESRELLNFGEIENSVIPFASENGFFKVNCDPNILDFLLEQGFLIYSLQAAKISNLPMEQAFDYRFERQNQANAKMMKKPNIQVCH